jgi:hypothetical protein
MQKQLTLFDVPASIKPGDRVKLRRKRKNAPYWKKGEVVTIPFS